jgi:hypothetical protein
MKPEQRLEYKVQTLVDRELAEEILAKLDWYRITLYNTTKELNETKKRLSDISWANDTQMGRY